MVTWVPTCLAGYTLVIVDAQSCLPSAVENRDGVDFDEHEREVDALHGHLKRVRPVPPPGPKARVEDGKHVDVHLLRAVHRRRSGEGA